MNEQVIQHIDTTLDELRAIYTRAATRIEGLKAGEKIVATELAKELAVETDQTGAQIYPLLLQMLRNYPGVDRRKGAAGGIYKLAPGESPKVVKIRQIKSVKEEIADEIA